MKKLLQCSIGLILTYTLQAQPLSFTITNLTGTDTISCLKPVINLAVSANYTQTVNYQCFGPNAVVSGTNISVLSPGNYTIIASLTSPSLTSLQTFTIYGGTGAPNISVVVPQQLLDCYNPQVQLQGMSTNSFVIFNWATPSGPSLNSSTLNVSTLASSPNTTLIGHYTLTVTDIKTHCQSSTIVPMYQDIFKPIAMASSGPSSPPCIDTPSMTLVNTSTPSAPPGSPLVHNLPAVSSWSSPFNTTPTLTTSYKTTAVGIYTMFAKDLANGCISALIMGPCTGLDNASPEENGFAIYPNPNNGNFTINYEDLTANSFTEIYNSTGDLVHKQDLNKGRNSIDLENVADGIYYIALIKGDRKVPGVKVLKQ